MGFLMFYL